MNKMMTLNNGYAIPALGIGTWKSENETVAGVIETALKIGYRHYDCASVYGNEKGIGEAFAKSLASGSIKRGELFVTSKLWNNSHRLEEVEKACKKTLADLRLDYLDLYLVHWAVAFAPGAEYFPHNIAGKLIFDAVPLQETWKAMEALVEQGLVKSIGVANFPVLLLFDLLSYAKIKPVMNQIEIHPYNSQQELVDFCHAKDIAVTAYSPLGTGYEAADKPLENPTVFTISENHRKTPAQILIRWALQRGLVVIPKSVTKNHLEQNLEVYDFELDAEDMDSLNALNKNRRFVDPVLWWDIPYFK